MKNKIKNVITDIWQRYWSVMMPFDVDLGDGHTGHVLPFYGPHSKWETLSKKNTDDADFVYLYIHYHVVVTHKKEVPLCYFGKTHCGILKSTDDGDLYFDGNAREKLIIDIKEHYYRTTTINDFRWHLFPIAWSVAGHDDRYKTAETIASRHPYSSLNDGFFIFLSHIMWHENSDYHLDTFEEAVLLEHSLQDKHKSELKSVFDYHTKNMAFDDIVRMKYKISNEIISKWLNTDSSKIDSFFEELDFMKELFCGLYDYYEAYMNTMNVDWNVLFPLVHHSVFSRREFDYKYKQLMNGPKHKITDKNGQVRLIEPRKEFAKTYPLLVTLKSSEALDDLFYHYVDELKPLPTLNMEIENGSDSEYYDLTPAKQKHIQGKFINNDLRISLNSNVFYAYSHFILAADLDKLPELENTPYNNNASDVVRLHFNVNFLIERYIYAYQFYFISNSSFLNNKRNLLELFSHNFPKIRNDIHLYKQRPDYNPIIDLIFLKNYDVVNTLMKKYGSYENIVSKMLQIAPVPYEDLIDAVDVFHNKVIIPALFHFAGLKSDKKNICKELRDYVSLIAKGALLYNRVPVIEMMELNKHVHDRHERFLNAGNNPESLMESMRDYKGDGNKEKPEHVLDRLMKEHNALVNNDETRRRSGSGNAAWLSLFDGTIKTEINDSIVPLLTSSELKQEGQEMRNCVGWGSYASKAMRGKCNLFSIRAADNTNIATLELGIKIVNDKIEVTIDQFRGYHNSIVHSDVEKDVIKAINKFKEEFAQNHVKQEAFKKYIEAAREQNSDKTPMEKAGYGFHDYESLKAAFEPWKEHLPKEIQSPEDLFKVLAFKETVEFLKEDHEA